MLHLQDHRKNLQELVRKQKRARATARKLEEERERERNQRIAENLAATAEAAKLAAKRSLRFKRGKLSTSSLKAGLAFTFIFLLYMSLQSRYGENLRNATDVETDEVPPECVLQASRLLAEEENVALKKPRCPATLIVPTTYHSSSLIAKSLYFFRSKAVFANLGFLLKEDNALARNSVASASATQSTHGKIHENKDHRNVGSCLFLTSTFPSGQLYKSFSDDSNPNAPYAGLFSGRSGAAVVSTSLPLKSRVLRPRAGRTHPKAPRTKGFGVQVNIHDPIAFPEFCGVEPMLGVWYMYMGCSRHAEVTTHWNDAECEQARLQARLCASRARRFVHLDADGDDADDDDAIEVLTSSSSSSSSSKSSCISEAQQVDNLLEPAKKPVGTTESSHWMPKTGSSSTKSGTPLRSLFDSHLKHLQERSKTVSDPLRFMEIYKQKCQEHVMHPRGDSRIEASATAVHPVQVNGTHFSYEGCASETDKTSEGASSIPSLAEESAHSRQVEVQSRQRLAPAVLGLSLTAELHRYETLSASEQHITGLEMTRQISQAQAEGLSMYHLSKNTAVSPIVFPRVSEPRTLTQTVTKRSFTTATATAAATTAFLRNSNRSEGIDFNRDSSIGNYNALRRIDPHASSMDVNDINVTPSNLEVSAALDDLVDVRSEQFKGILQQRASELHARRHEAELLLKYAAKLDREERKVAALESKAVKALTQSKGRRPTEEAYIPFQQSSHSPSPTLQTLKAFEESPPPPALPTASILLPDSSTFPCSFPVALPFAGQVSVVNSENDFPVEVLESTASLPNQPSPRSSTKLLTPPQQSSLGPPTILRGNDNGAGVGESDRRDFNQQSLSLQHQFGHRNHESQISSPQRLNQGSIISTSSSPSGLRAYSDSLSSSQFVSQIEVRLTSLQKELQRHEKLLSRIDAQKKMANKDRLVRLETTLENHRKVYLYRHSMVSFCLEIIDNIKMEIGSCHQSLCEKSQFEATPTVQMTSGASARTSPSSEPSFLGKSIRPCFRKSNNTMSLLSSCSTVEEEAVKGTCTVSVEGEEASVPSETDTLKSLRGGRALTFKSDVGEDGKLERLMGMGTVKSASPKASTLAKLGETMASETSSESSITQRLASPMEMSLIVKPDFVHSATNDVDSEGHVSSAEKLSLKMPLPSRTPSVVEKTSLSILISDDQISSATLARSESGEPDKSRSTEAKITLQMSSEALGPIRSTQMHTEMEESKASINEQAISSAASMHSNVSKCVKPIEFGSFVEVLGSEVPSQEIIPVEKSSFPMDPKPMSNSVAAAGELNEAPLEVDVGGYKGKAVSSEVASRADPKDISGEVELTTTSVEVFPPDKEPESSESNHSRTEIKEAGEDCKEEKGERSGSIETVASELSLKTPSLNSNTLSAGVQELNSAKESINQITTGSKSESASDTADVYTEDFEDEAFADDDPKQDHGCLVGTDAILEVQVSDSASSLDFIEIKTNALLDGFIDQWLNDFIGEGVITDTTGMVVNTPSRTVLLFKDAMQFFFHLRASSKPGTFEEVLNSIQYPPRFTETYAEDEDLKICERVPQSRLVNRPLFFDLIRIGMLDIFAGEDEDVKNNREPRLNSARLHMWRGRHRPESQSRWEAILAPQLEAILGMSLDPAESSGPSPSILPEPQVFDPFVLRSSLVQWTLYSKTCWIEQLLEAELRDEDSSWFNLKPFEEQVIDSAVEAITLELANDEAAAVVKRLRHEHECEEKCLKEQETGKSVGMGAAHSHGSTRWAASKPKPKSKPFSLDTFVSDLVKQMVERTVDGVIEEKQRKKSNAVEKTEESKESSTNSKADESELEVLSSTNDFFRTTLADDHLDKSDSTPDGFMEDDELSTTSTSSSLQTTTSSSPLEDSTNALVVSPPSPPPPPPGIPEDQLVGLIVNIPSRLASLFKDGMQFFWSLRTSSKLGTFEKALREATYPPRFTMDCVEREDVELCRSADEMSLLNRPLFFDFIREILQRVYEGEDEDVQLNRMPVVNSARYRLWLGPRRPNSLTLLERIVQTNLEADFGVSLKSRCGNSEEDRNRNPSPPRVVMDTNRLPRLAQWTIKRKDWLDQRLELEMRADEPTWFNYRPFEQNLLNNLTIMVMTDIFNEVYDRCAKKVAREVYYEDLHLLNGKPGSQVRKNFGMDLVRVRSPSSMSGTTT
ncbi:unnamed protein product [Hydatigera taeniaeformis]|uniref:Protein kinase domain-containing protein n=1 Tax=Hydatigena taeniaeformis TaxID=6205 RepID=A0A0R3WHM1_HYDTA|nr:unnamed protein product [Hydatigera taeniaeformis]